MKSKTTCGRTAIVIPVERIAGVVVVPARPGRHVEVSPRRSRCWLLADPCGRVAPATLWQGRFLPALGLLADPLPTFFVLRIRVVCTRSCALCLLPSPMLAHAHRRVCRFFFRPQFLPTSSRRGRLRTAICAAVARMALSRGRLPELLLHPASALKLAALRLRQQPSCAHSHVPAMTLTSARAYSAPTSAITRADKHLTKYSTP